MSRQISTKKRFLSADLKYNSILVNILINKVLKNGKKLLSKYIVYSALEQVKKRTDLNPCLILEKSIRNCSPRVQLKAKRIGGSTYQSPTIISKYCAINMSVRWIVHFSKKRTGKSMSFNLANEILDAAKLSGNAYKKKEEMHKIAEANKAFAQFR